MEVIWWQPQIKFLDKRQIKIVQGVKVNPEANHYLGSLLLTFNFNPSMDKISKVWGEITDPFPNFNGCTAEVWEWISNSSHIYDGCNYSTMLGLQLNQVSKRGTGSSEIRASVSNIFVSCYLIVA